MRKSKSGFTIVELLVVIAVIGILTTIGIMSFTRYQASSRDTQRSSRTTLIAEALEKYYDKNGEYPSCSTLTQSATIVDTTVLPGIDPLALLTPKSAASDTNSIKCTDLTGAASDPDVFAYVGDGSAACATGASCLSWTLKYIDESTGAVKTLQSRRNTAIATSGASTLAASGSGFTQINASWGGIDNAISYDVQRATDAGFTTNLGTQTVTTTSASVTGLSYNTNYYLRVRPNAAIGQGNWSNTVTATTWTLTQPTISATAQSFTQINTSWGGILHATSYEVQRATDSGFTANLVTQTTTGTTSNFTGLAYNTTYYFRVHPLGGGFTGAWSGTDTEPTWGLSTPSIAAVTTSTSTFTSSWGAIAHAASYNVQCSSDGSTWSGCTGSTTGLSYNWGPTWQGTALYFRTQAANGSYVSAWSNTAGATTGIDNPAPYTVGQNNSLAGGWNAMYVSSNATCPAGTTPSYDWYHNSNGTNGFWVSGTQYQTVGYSLSWNEYVSVSVASRCIKGAVSSGFVWANNTADMSLYWPTVTTWLPGDRTMHWSGTCPQYATADNFYWRTQGVVNASGNTWASEPQGVYYSNQGIAWGNGNAHVTLSCDGPWGTASIEGTSSYGSGCVPTATLAVCTQ
jgi:prepilin-type N-terminal cleavage/methylation domain-containing protein